MWPVTDLLASKEEPEVITPYDTKDPINKSLGKFYIGSHDLVRAQCLWLSRYMYMQCQNIKEETDFVLVSFSSE